MIVRMIIAAQQTEQLARDCPKPNSMVENAPAVNDPRILKQRPPNMRGIERESMFSSAGIGTVYLAHHKLRGS